MRLAFLGLLCALAACESAPPVASELRRAPKSQLFVNVATSATPARVAFIRDAGGSHVRNWRISVDGVKVATLDKGEFVIIDVNPGLRQFRVELDVDSAPREFAAWVDTSLEPGGEQVFRIGNTSEMKIQIARDPGAPLPK